MMLQTCVVPFRMLLRRILPLRPGFRPLCTTQQEETDNFYVPMEFKKKIARKKELFPHKCVTQTGKPLSLDEIRSCKNKLISDNIFCKRLFVCDLLKHARKHFSFEMLSHILDYCVQENLKLDLAEYSQILLLCDAILSGSEGERELLDTEKKEELVETILSTLDTMHTISDVFDANTCWAVVTTIASTPKWRKASRYLEMYKLTTNPKVGLYFKYLENALKEQDMKLSHEIIQEMVLHRLNNMSLYSDCFNDTHLKYYLQAVDAGLSDLETLFDMYSKNYWKITERQMNMFLDYIQNSSKIEYHFGIADVYSRLRRYQKNETTTELSNSAICQECFQSFHQNDITIEEFERIKAVSSERVLLSRDIFWKSSPEEYDRIAHYMDSRSYDYVADILNLIGATQFDYANINSHLRNITETLNSRQKKRILFISRDVSFAIKLEKAVNRLKQEFDVDYLQTKHSKGSDDVYILLCAMKSGYHTKVVSNDTFTDHAVTFSDREYKLLRKWQICRQVNFQFHFRTRKFTMQHPEKPTYGPQISNQGYHIPFFRSDTNLIDPIGNPRSVLCLREKK